MCAIKNLLFTLLFCLHTFSSFSQPLPEHDTASLNTKKPIADIAIPNEKLQLKKMIIPAVLITYGVSSLSNKHLKDLNETINKNIVPGKLAKQFHLDHYLVLLPAAGAFGLEVMGVKGKNNFKDKAMIYFMSSLITNTTVYSLKQTISSKRPDGSNSNSFPSGHTAQAFASAEFLRREYKDVSGWYGAAGYTIAAATGYLRMYNNKHWFSDVLAGAGIGIASVHLSYWLYPKFRRLFSKKAATDTSIMPYFDNSSIGISFSHRF